VKFTPEAGQDAVVAIYRPKEPGKYPTVIVQHFLGGTKDHIALIPLLNALATKGFTVAAMDGRYRGDRQNGTSLSAAMLESLRTGKGHPFLIDTAYDITRLLDYLQTRPDVDASRIGMTGLSEGGVLTWMSAVIDDRIKVAAPIIGVTCFADTLKDEENPTGQAIVKMFEPTLKAYAQDLGEKECNCHVLRQAWLKLLPGSLDKFDATNLVPLIAPRPLLVICHEEDELFPIAGAKKVESCSVTRYKDLKAADHFDFRVDPGLKHAAFSFNDVTGVISWMERWLKDGGKPMAAVPGQ
jgi:dienelactone hydrolase